MYSDQNTFTYLRPEALQRGFRFLWHTFKKTKFCAKTEKSDTGEHSLSIYASLTSVLLIIAISQDKKR